MTETLLCLLAIAVPSVPIAWMGYREWKKQRTIENEAAG